MSGLRIPKRFKLLGHTIEVKLDPKLQSDRNWAGAASYEDSEITLQPITESTPRSKTKYEQTFCHELIHHLLWHGGAAINHRLDGEYIHQKEEFVDLLASLLHQALTTMEYDDDPSC